jgi:hypothetical protein
MPSSTAEVIKVRLLGKQVRGDALFRRSAIPAGKSHIQNGEVENLPQSSFSKFVFVVLVAFAGSVHRSSKRSPQGLAVYQT